LRKRPPVVVVGDKNGACSSLPALNVFSCSEYESTDDIWVWMECSWRLCRGDRRVRHVERGVGYGGGGSDMMLSLISFAVGGGTSVL
jgi:hypothetical protein